MRIKHLLFKTFTTALILSAARLTANESPGLASHNQTLRNPRGPLTTEKPAAGTQLGPGPESKFDAVGNLDPFFPKRKQKAVTNNPAAKFSLEGITMGTIKRLAVINGRTLEVDELVELKVGDSRATIRCLQIGEDSAVIEITNTREQVVLNLHRKSANGQRSSK